MSIYTCSDFHGFKSLYLQINDFIKPEDKVIFIGDAADRGPYGWELIKMIIDNPQWTYLMGNHEDMLIKSFCGLDKYENTKIFFANGGRSTSKAFLEDTKENQQYYMNILRKIPYTITYLNSNKKNIFLSHSGSTNVENKEDLLWSRSHFNEEVPAGIDVVIHGHTPIPYLAEILDFFEVYNEIKDNQVFWYKNYTKCDIDNSTIVTGSCILLNLDTFEEHVFHIDSEEKKFLW